jgi:hypothetical protein
MKKKVGYGKKPFFLKKRQGRLLNNSYLHSSQDAQSKKTGYPSPAGRFRRNTA